VETSALLAAELEGDATIRRALRRGERHVTSALTLAEMRRAVVRAQRFARVTPSQAAALGHSLATFARRCEVVAITEEVLARAGRPFPVEPVRTLDAIHLATIELLGIAPGLVTVLTRDARVRENALGLGFSVE
jgi:predicted nucleic acid-binding protein